VAGVLGALGGNDYLRGLDPEVSRGIWIRILTKLDARMCLRYWLGLQAGTLWWRIYAL